MPFSEPLAYTQSLGLERHPRHAKRAMSAPAVALPWLVLAWRASGGRLNPAPA